MNPILGLGQIIVSIALIAAILLQARGTGLSGTFGGDSAVYRSRRGRRTAAVAVHHRAAGPVRHLLARVVHPRADHLTGSPRHDLRALTRSFMTRTDTIVVGTLVTLLAILAALIGGPAIQLAAAPASPSPSSRQAPGSRFDRTSKASSAQPSSVSPLTARTQADRDLVALLFAGLVRNGPGGTTRARPGRALDGRRDRQDVDGRASRRRALARRHAGHARTTSCSRSRRSRTRPTRDHPATSWSEVTVAATGPRQVRFTLTTPLGGFLQALTQPIAPVHLLGDRSRSSSWPTTRSAGCRSARGLRDHRAQCDIRVARSGGDRRGDGGTESVSPAPRPTR